MHETGWKTKALWWIKCVCWHLTFLDCESKCIFLVKSHRSQMAMQGLRVSRHSTMQVSLCTLELRGQGCIWRKRNCWNVFQFSTEAVCLLNFSRVTYLLRDSQRLLPDKSSANILSSFWALSKSPEWLHLLQWNVTHLTCLVWLTPVFSLSLVNASELSIVTHVSWLIPIDSLKSFCLNMFDSFESSTWFIHILVDFKSILTWSSWFCPF